MENAFEFTEINTASQQKRLAFYMDELEKEVRND